MLSKGAPPGLLGQRFPDNKLLAVTTASGIMGTPSFPVSVPAKIALSPPNGPPRGGGLPSASLPSAQAHRSLLKFNQNFPGIQIMFFQTPFH